MSRSGLQGLLAGAVLLAAGQAWAAEVLSMPVTLDAAATGPVAPPEKPLVDRIKQPTDWLKWGMDERIREEYFNNNVTLNQQAPNHETNQQRFRTRLWATLTPCKEFEFYARLEWEARHYCEPASKVALGRWDANTGAVFIDNLFGKIKLEAIDTVFTVGRQDIILGDGWLVLDGTPLDGSATIYFDAVRSTTTIKSINTTFDGIFINNSAESDGFLPTLGDVDTYLAEQDERGVIFQATNKSLKNTEITPYFIYKHDNAQIVSNGDNADLYTFGTRIAEEFTPHIKGRLEGAGQFGSRQTGAANPVTQVCSWGLNSRIGYYFNDSWKNAIHLSYEYLSGDDPGTQTNEQFDPLWGRWPQWSELWANKDAGETRPGETTNLQRLSLGYEVTPLEQIQILLGYHALFANQNTPGGATTLSADGHYRGSLFTAVLKYKINRYVSGHLWSEYFIPGNYYAAPSDDNAVFLRAEMVFTF